MLHRHFLLAAKSLPSLHRTSCYKLKPSTVPWNLLQKSSATFTNWQITVVFRPAEWLIRREQRFSSPQYRCKALSGIFRQLMQSPLTLYPIVPRAAAEHTLLGRLHNAQNSHNKLDFRDHLKYSARRAACRQRTALSNVCTLEQIVNLLLILPLLSPPSPSQPRDRPQNNTEEAEPWGVGNAQSQPMRARTTDPDLPQHVRKTCKQSFAFHQQRPKTFLTPETQLRANSKLGAYLRLCVQRKQ